MMTPDLTNAIWTKSSHSNGNNGACVEVAILAGAAAVRDSKDSSGPALVFAPVAFGAFLDAVKNGQLDG